MHIWFPILKVMKLLIKENIHNLKYFCSKCIHIVFLCFSSLMRKSRKILHLTRNYTFFLDWVPFDIKVTYNYILYDQIVDLLTKILTCCHVDKLTVYGRKRDGKYLRQDSINLLSNNNLQTKYHVPMQAHKFCTSFPVN